MAGGGCVVGVKFYVQVEPVHKTMSIPILRNRDIQVLFAQQIKLVKRKTGGFSLFKFYVHVEPVVLFATLTIE